jgi:hypothetical protein
MTDELDPPLVNPNGTYNITKADGSICPEKTAQWIDWMMKAGLAKATLVGPDGREYVVVSQELERKRLEGK